MAQPAYNESVRRQRIRGYDVTECDRKDSGLTSALERERFIIDQAVAEKARHEFTQNYNINWLCSKSSSLVGVASLIGLRFSAYECFSSPISALGLAGMSLMLNRLTIDETVVSGSLNSCLELDIRQNRSDSGIICGSFSLIFKK